MPINDTLSSKARLLKKITGIGKKGEEDVPQFIKVMSPDNDRLGFPFQRTLGALAVIIAIAWAFMIWKDLPISNEISPDRLRQWIVDLERSDLAIPIVLAIYTIGGLFFMPLTVMIAATATAFGPALGLGLAVAGSLLNAAVTFFIGFLLGEKFFGNIANTAYQKVSGRIRHAGVAGVAAVRMLPLAPFTLVNMIFGVSEIRFIPYIIGTFLGLLPGTVAMVVPGDSLGQLWRNPEPQNILYLAFGIAVWIGIVVGIHYLVRRHDRISNKAQV